MSVERPDRSSDRRDGTRHEEKTRSTRTGVLDAVGRSATRQAAVQAAGPGGTVVLPGLHDQETSCDVHAIIRSQVALLGSSASSQDDGRRAASLLEEGQVILEIFAALLISCVTLYRYVSLLACQCFSDGKV
jgi:threonine dehydrogenase-like Zn-dependent dehydrogenase